MNYTLNQSVSKFIQLRQRLRELIGPPKPSTPELPPQPQKQDFKAKRGKKGLQQNCQKENSQRCNWSSQETQRKHIKAQTLKTKPNDIASLDGKELIKSKEKALQDINELLLRKQWILSEIQKKIAQQSCLRQQQTAQWQPCAEEKTAIKAPNLHVLRQQRKKMKKISLI